MRSGLIAFGAIFFVFQFARRLLVDPGFVILHFTFLADQIDIRIFSSGHESGGLVRKMEPSPRIELGTSPLPWVRSTD